MKHALVVTMLAAALTLGGCSPKIDGSSEEAFRSSVERIANKLDEDKKEEFAEAIMVIGMSSIKVGSLFAGMQDPDDLVSEMRTEVDGLTADQVISKARDIRQKHKDRERGQALDEIKELLTQKQAAADAADGLQNFKVIRSRYLTGRGYFGSDSAFEITVRNDTDHPISRAHFQATLASPDRAVPWKTGEFNYSIPGGLEPGEQKTWTLDPSFEWGRVDAPKDAILTIVPTRLDDAKGEPLYDAEQFGEAEAERLAALQKRFG